MREEKIVEKNDNSVVCGLLTVELLLAQTKALDYYMFGTRSRRITFYVLILCCEPNFNRNIARALKTKLYYNM